MIGSSLTDFKRDLKYVIIIIYLFIEISNWMNKKGQLYFSTPQEQQLFGQGLTIGLLENCCSQYTYAWVGRRHDKEAGYWKDKIRERNKKKLQTFTQGFAKGDKKT